MKTITKGLAKGTIATVAAGAMAMASATPTFAQSRDRDGIDAGDIIAGALIIGGIAAVAGAIGNDGDNRYRGNTYGGPYYGNDRYDDRYDNRSGYNSGNSRQAVEQCVRAAQQNARRYGNGQARVTDIRNIDRRRDGFRVKGTILVNERNRGWGRDYNYRNSGRDYDQGRFTCDVRYGRVVGLDFKGIRGLS